MQGLCIVFILLSVNLSVTLYYAEIISSSTVDCKEILEKPSPSSILLFLLKKNAKTKRDLLPEPLYLELKKNMRRSVSLFPVGNAVRRRCIGTSSSSCSSFSSFSSSSDAISSFIPAVVESTPRYERVMDIYSRLLRERIVCLHGPINDALSSVITSQLLFLESEDPGRPLFMYINSPGGVVTAGLAIYDTMQYIKCPITTICVGQAASMGSLLLAGGSPGQVKKSKQK